MYLSPTDSVSLENLKVPALIKTVYLIVFGSLLSIFFYQSHLIYSSSLNIALSSSLDLFWSVHLFIIQTSEDEDTLNFLVL